MLPAWATVAIAAISALAGIVGGVAVTLLRNRFERGQNDAMRRHEREQQEGRLAHERSEQWTERLVRASDDFSTGVEQAILGVRAVIDAVGTKGDVQLAAQEAQRQIDEAKRRIDEAVARLARIKLLFGADADAVLIAKDLVTELSIARGAAQKTDPTFAWEKLEKISGLHDRFNAAAFEMISSPRWRVGSELELRYRIAGTADGGDA